jgi:uncharacterized membrane protein
MSTIVQSFEARELKKRPLSVRIADELTSRFGSFSFLTFNTLFFVFWIFINTNHIPNFKIIDPFPFPLMTTIVSIEAIILTLIVLMSQQRQSQVATVREEIDMQVNRIAEKEITKALFLLSKLAEKQGIKLDGDKELQEMLKGIEVSYIEKKLQEQLADNKQNIIKEVVEEVEKKLTQKE